MLLSYLFSGSMLPGFGRGDLVALHGHVDESQLKTGDIVVYQLDGRPIPIIHRIHRLHNMAADLPDGSAGTKTSKDPIELLTKGDNNRSNDVGLYPGNQEFLRSDQIVGKAYMLGPGVGWLTILMNDYPILKYLLLGGMAILVIITREA